MAGIHPNEVFNQLLEDRAKHVGEIVRQLEEGKKTIILERLPGSALPFILNAVHKRVTRPMVVLTAGGERAEDLVGDFEFFGNKNVHHYPKWEVLPFDEEDLSLEVTAKTLDCLEAIARRQDAPKSSPFIICAPVDATMLRVIPKSHLGELSLVIKWGDTINTTDLDRRLRNAGYTREPLVEARGEYSIRGGIIDIYPLNAEFPYRIDLFGDEIESIRTFDLSTQRSLGDLGMEATIIVQPGQLKNQALSMLAEGRKLDTFFDLLPDDTVFVLESPEKYNEVCQFFQSAVTRQHEIAGHRGEPLPEVEEILLPATSITEKIGRFRRMEHSEFPAATDGKSRHFAFDYVNYAPVALDLENWILQIRKFQTQDYTVVVVCDNDGQVQRFDELLREQEISALPVKGDALPESFEVRSVLSGFQDVVLVVGGLQTGFALGDMRLCIITDREIFGRYKRRYIYKKIYKGKPVQRTSDIRRNDYVVHVEHGIGQFLGMRVQELDGRQLELIELLYADNNKLLVPVDKITKVQRYAGPESAQPTLDKLGSPKWGKRRKKNTEEIEKIAEELLQIYAEREVAQRPPHSGDTHLQREFEASFLYQETPDQLQAISEAKADMEKQRPMDRLVCGDVGFGKTEVAIRAIFKCHQSGRQAAILCPTTILAQQHYNNFRERFADYPIRMDMISRFRKPAEVRETKKKLRLGELDVVVGTHALLSKDIQFQNLGLVVVDEEQRFGVKAKERLKELRRELDLLTLSATPIPRTLHMALSGLRDLSLITTPPPDRQPIKTRVISFEEEQIAEAILRELNRGGQVYFVHNRVNTIQEVARRVQEIVPHARIAVAHGQMKESELEETMINFIANEHDILVATTIIESGVDIPNCNTIIINRADAFGLAQLYQLRGRVGRERRRSYAYLIVPQGKAITDSAVKRLQAIEEFADLGAGFSIAMRDLEIRGAGDILGKAQHGAITEIGFELFCELLEEKVAERKDGASLNRPFDVDIRWDSASYIPPNYMPMEAQRVTFYKRIASAREQEEIDEIHDELRDRYGELPQSAKTFIDTNRLRLACQPHRIAGVRKSGTLIRLTFIDTDFRGRLPNLEASTKEFGEFTTLRPDGYDQAVLNCKPDLDAAHVLEVMRRYLDHAAAKAKKENSHG
ncbi:MAG: transcription-repair coupling factor [Candidatus Sumerlaeia bacterium]|nr:transcription-repair coupling factor [Candidatus Sumerlaeia bacterium]